MISNDKNIEQIADFVEEAKQWLLLRKEYAKYDGIDKCVRIFSSLALLFVFAILLFLIMVFLSLAAAYYIAEVVDSIPLGFCCVSVFNILIMIVFYMKRHSWIERPLVKFLVSILVDQEK